MKAELDRVGTSSDCDSFSVLSIEWQPRVAFALREKSRFTLPPLYPTVELYSGQ